MLKQVTTMGMLIFTRDAQAYREGDYVEGKGVVSSPSDGLTVIVHEKRPSKEECMGWLDLISYRMVWVCDKAPDIKDDRVIYDKTMKRKKSDYIPAIQATLRWSDRNRVWSGMTKVPVPLMLSFLKENVRDINLYRLLAKSFRWCPEEWQQAAICFATKPISGRPAFPKKKKKEELQIQGFRESDLYTDMIIQDGKVANMIRSTCDELPKGMKKRKQGVVDWL